MSRAMDEKDSESKVKISRSKARHLRRKRLLARRAAEKEDNQPPGVLNTQQKGPELSSNPSNSATKVPNRVQQATLKENTILSPVSEKPDPTSGIEENKLDSKGHLDKHFKKSEAENIKTCEAQSESNGKRDDGDLNHVDSLEVKIKEDKEDKRSTDQSKATLAKMNAEGKSREQIKAEREAKKAAKSALKVKKSTTETKTNEKVPKESKVENKANKSTTKDDQTLVINTETKRKTEETKPSVDNVADNLSKLTVDDAQKTKSKAELKAERRAKQEAQRAAKAEGKKEKVKPEVKPALKSDAKITSEKPPGDKTSEAPEEPSRKTTKKLTHQHSHEFNLFKHLFQEREQSTIIAPKINSHIHPAIIRLGAQYAAKVVVGSNARSIALLAALKDLITDFERPPQVDFSQGLKAALEESAAYLNHCRPLAVSMQNTLRYLKGQRTHLPSTISDEEAKSRLNLAIDTFIQEQVILAGKAISMTIQQKISHNDVIMTYGFSSLIQTIFCEAYDAGRKFSVIVVDSRPALEGKELLRRLTKHGLDCSYVLIGAISSIMPRVNKVFLGAHAILANGAVMSRVGTGQVALMAKSSNVPVLVACETYKTSERVQTDSIVHNELGNPDELVENINSPLSNWRNRKSLNILNLNYDVTPADLVTAVVTERGILPCTSIPVILRIRPSEF